jgi:hypothetical protein
MLRHGFAHCRAPIGHGSANNIANGINYGTANDIANDIANGVTNPTNGIANGVADGVADAISGPLRVGPRGGDQPIYRRQDGVEHPVQGGHLHSGASGRGVGSQLGRHDGLSRRHHPLARHQNDRRRLCLRLSAAVSDRRAAPPVRGAGLDMQQGGYDLQDRRQGRNVQARRQGYGHRRHRLWL